MGKSKQEREQGAPWERVSELFAKEEKRTLHIQEPDHRRALDIKAKNGRLCSEKERE